MVVAETKRVNGIKHAKWCIIGKEENQGEQLWRKLHFGSTKKRIFSKKSQKEIDIRGRPKKLTS